MIRPSQFVDFIGKNGAPVPVLHVPRVVGGSSTWWVRAAIRGAYASVGVPSRSASTPAGSYVCPVGVLRRWESVVRVSDGRDRRAVYTFSDGCRVDVDDGFSASIDAPHDPQKYIAVSPSWAVCVRHMLAAVHDVPHDPDIDDTPRVRGQQCALLVRDGKILWVAAQTRGCVVAHGHVERAEPSYMRAWLRRDVLRDTLAIIGNETITIASDAYGTQVAAHDGALIVDFLPHKSQWEDARASAADALMRAEPPESAASVGADDWRCVVAAVCAGAHDDAAVDITVGCGAVTLILFGPRGRGGALHEAGIAARLAAETPEQTWAARVRVRDLEAAGGGHAFSATPRLSLWREPQRVVIDGTLDESGSNMWRALLETV